MTLDEEFEKWWNSEAVPKFTLSRSPTDYAHAAFLAGAKAEREWWTQMLEQVKCDTFQQCYHGIFDGEAMLAAIERRIKERQ